MFLAKPWHLSCTFARQEKTMHIHRNSMAAIAADIYSSAQAGRAAEAQRAAEVRKKLLKGASEIGGSATPEETLMIGQWMDSRHSQVQTEDQYHPSASGKDPEFG
jgi:hypothetical protein